ncbi:type II CAAX prenyl endopeptidase Rce1 family protein [Pedobacter xixiisoli]
MYDFFKNPSIHFNLNRSFNESLKDLFAVFLKAFLFLFLNYLFVSLIDFIIVQSTHFSFQNAINDAQKGASNKNSVLFFLLFAPIVEELIFRLPLKTSRINILTSFVFAYLLFVFISKEELDIFNTATLMSSIAYFFIAFLIVYKLPIHLLQFQTEKSYRIYFYAMALIFGLLHIFNFMDLVPTHLLFFAPIFVIHQMIVGFFLAYLRLKRGILWSILLHFLFNLPPTIGYFFTSS